ncbi:hypothetical protein COU20_01650 [Candidatus Kaiserbacteria bacterium CG10_big_fil_rev_8_21_14_0_10_59_10]|uniref:Uncharacterized protein n=1 Tax=Candidatus Kaiserbacteria bacterium CG10_big_fil_rev_8_21_14_0_10_59_10 TaxID=1974612 RepID=A0A2H0U844_9BACT|nr:MAG: hypothetical protein COU20_01650 [Candidatus Kaiserbacteria bacterium CG10_big_fil_rev_8_21_14_0_10_59_10]
MKKCLLLFSVAAAVLAAAPANAETAVPIGDGIGKAIADCVRTGAVLTVDGQDFHLRPGVDFRVVRHAAYNQYGVQWRGRLQRDKRWEFAADVARKCIDKATGQVASSGAEKKDY